MAELGRPLKYGEPVQKRQFNFPESLSKALNKAARERGEDVTKVLHDALRNELERPVKDRMVAVGEIKRAVQEALLASGNVTVEFGDKDSAKLKKYSDAVGMSPERFIEETMRLVLGMPIDDVRSFLHLQNELREIEEMTAALPPARKKRRGEEAA